MKVFFIVYFVLAYEFAIGAFACSPRQGIELPTLEQNFSQAESVFLGTIEKISKIETKEPAGFTPYELNVRVTKNFKGKLKSPRVIASRANTCNAFATSIEVGSKCLIFLSGSQDVMAGVFAGEASICSSSFNPQSKTQMDAIVARISPLQSRKN